MGYMHLLAADETTEAIGRFIAKLFMFGGLGGLAICLLILIIGAGVRRGVKKGPKP